MTNELRERALRLLERRAFSRGELVGRLEAAGADPGAARCVVDRLVDAGLVDDQSYARSIAAATRGPLAEPVLAAKLRARGITADLAETVAREACADTVEVVTGFVAQLRRRYRTLDDASAERRIAGALYRRGFTADTISEALRRNGLEQEPPEELT